MPKGSAHSNTSTDGQWIAHPTATSRCLRWREPAPIPSGEVHGLPEKLGRLTRDTRHWPPQAVIAVCT